MSIFDDFLRKSSIFVENLRFSTKILENLRFSRFSPKPGRFRRKQLARYARSRSAQQALCLLCAACALRAHRERAARVRAFSAFLDEMPKMAIFLEISISGRNADFEENRKSSFSAKMTISSIFYENRRFSRKSTIFAKIRENLRFSRFSSNSAFLDEMPISTKILARSARSRSTQRHARLWTSRACLLCAACALRAHRERAARVRAFSAFLDEMPKMALFGKIDISGRNADFAKKC